MRAPAIAAVALALTPAPAQAELSLTADREQRGRIHLVAGPPAAGLRIVELVGGTEVAVAGTATEAGIDATTGWSCTQERTFQAVSDAERSAPATVSTPSCAHRLALRALRRGAGIRVTIRDRWRTGDVGARLCVRRPRAHYICRRLLVTAGQWETSHVLRATRAGRWAVRVTTPEQELTRTLVVRDATRRARWLVLATGDSMMLAPSAALERRLPRRARVRGDVYIGSGITKPSVVDWATLPARQLRATDPDATVVTLGMADVHPLEDEPCCGEAWTAAYARHARRMMRGYTRAGAPLVWLNLPYLRDPRRDESVTAVNAAVSTAATGMARVRVIDVATLITPGGIYRDAMERHGRTVRLREDDGVHLAPGGARIVARRTASALADLGVL